MVQTVEANMGGGGSIKVGTTGTIGALMSRELDSKKFSPQTPASYRSKSPTVCSFIAGSATSPKRVKPGTSSDEASSSVMSEDNKKCPEIVRKTKHYNRKTNQIPILENDNVFVDGTPMRQKPERKGPYRVEIVDINCGDVDRTWAGPIKNRLKKLGFSKLSESPV
ncbi:PREDICTED: uncharacterized protein LOC109226706 [Nicotiana attenuata]|uniref:Uncharacterized protein n=1 Tax=Nicotiana attenuata TaxID=49451 RepID=A0A1J6IBP8_NICAT|nr:PREDICTED: uncharacterized protein LOC109226706 [Nicotiana attenuata]XP_019247090.1 PREDICTED: uncharacterized protein LOC109226706 [Nicotiana attenuata]XP_019247091.1 PREDICTED: uncharacterized protein LOC109226706 [Nicotiana attenuata]XP_019247093.1 PREDICTED: uncharacterized protein LOC109226706 [Nicotiana attenuata]OIT01852.1 hypothetical protein A4A49_20202 [Nicotiana attenuata]